MSEFQSKEGCFVINKKIMDEINDVKVKIAELPEKVLEKMREEFVTKEAFAPIQKLVYGLVGAILTTVLLGVLALVLKT